MNKEERISFITKKIITLIHQILDDTGELFKAEHLSMDPELPSAKVIRSLQIKISEIARTEHQKWFIKKNIKCLDCETPIEYEYSALRFMKKFCNQACAARFNNKQKDYSLHKPGPKPKGDTKIIDGIQVKKYICKNRGCSSEFYSKHKRILCDKCANIDRQPKTIKQCIRCDNDIEKNLFCNECLALFKNNEDVGNSLPIIKGEYICKYCDRKANYISKSGYYCCEKVAARCPDIILRNKFSNIKTDQKKAQGIAVNTDKTIKKLPTKLWAEFTYKGRGHHKAILIRDLGHKCQGCQKMVWNNKPITLELDHIDGDHHNNVRDNLRLLCPTCHALTDTFCRADSTKRKYSDEEIIATVKESYTLNEVLTKLNYRYGSQQTILKVMFKYNVSLKEIPNE